MGLMANEYGKQKIQIARGKKENMPNFENGELGLILEDGEISIGNSGKNTFINRKWRQSEQVSRQYFNFPSFERLDEPIIERDDIQWMVDEDSKLLMATPINAKEILGEDAIDDWYMYVSTDHASDTAEQSGIGLLTAPDLAGPWTDQGKVFDDSDDNGRTENHQILYNHETNEFHLYYRHGDPPAVIKLATSSNGENDWTKHGKVIPTNIDPTNSEITGDGHVGYSRIFRLQNRWYATHLMGGRNSAAFGFSYSYDGFDWWTPPKQIIGNSDILEEHNKRRATYNQGGIVNYNGELWFIFCSSEYTSGYEGGHGRKFFAGKFDRNLEKISNMQRILEIETGDWEEDNGISNAETIQHNGLLYIIYTSKANNGSVGLGVEKI